MITRVLTLLSIFAAVVPAAAQDEATQALAARTELHPIPTLTLSDAQFLAGDAGATPVTVSGQFRIAQGSGRLPVVVLMHGSGGMGANIESWARELNAMGVSTFALDGFTGRGLTQVSTDQAKLGRLNFILDIYRALDILAKHARVDSARIALMGFSRGGQAALYASLQRFHRTWNKSGVDFAGYVAFYPDCATTFVSDTDVAGVIRIFGGTPDDYNPVALCKAYVERLRAAGRDVVLTEYPDAPHSFDNPLGAQPAAASPTSQTVRHCQIREEPAGRLINAASGAPFTYNDPCVERGTHIGYDPAAAAAARRSVKEFLRATLKLN
jgi:dienelactone hydrolase